MSICFHDGLVIEMAFHSIYCIFSCEANSSSNIDASTNGKMLRYLYSVLPLYIEAKWGRQLQNCYLRLINGAQMKYCTNGCVRFGGVFPA